MKSLLIDTMTSCQDVVFLNQTAGTLNDNTLRWIYPDVKTSLNKSLLKN